MELFKARLARRRGVLVVLAMVVLAAVMMLTPVGAHVNDSVSHLWNKHIKGKTDARYVQRLWAVIHFVPAGPHPEIHRGQGATGVDFEERGTPGGLDDAVVVTFNRNVRNCSYQVTHAAHDSDYDPANNDVTFSASRFSGDPKAVYVRGFINNFEEGETQPFHLAVIC